MEMEDPRVRSCRVAAHLAVLEIQEPLRGIKLYVEKAAAVQWIGLHNTRRDQGKLRDGSQGRREADVVSPSTAHTSTCRATRQAQIEARRHVGVSIAVLPDRLLVGEVVQRPVRVCEGHIGEVLDHGRLLSDKKIIIILLQYQQTLATKVLATAIVLTSTSLSPSVPALYSPTITYPYP